MTSSLERGLGGDDSVRATSNHVGAEQGAGFIQGWLAPEERRKIEAHIDRCAECRKYISELAHLSWSNARRPEAAEGQDAGLERGTSVGRYVVDGWLGRGAMGIVYSAYDPKLHRKVALKVVDTSIPGGTARLEREAQAMARLSHPNVVAIHDIGVHEGQLFIAMEFIEGVTLRSWLCDESRTFREVLHAFMQAGRGLEAAHESGLVHRDFKPDNVLCGSSGRVCVSDFGLARAALGGAMGESSVANQIVAGLAAHAGSRTIPYLAGTPRYMAPEQYLGQAMDARSDQFSFSVALYQALYRQDPFSGKTLSELASAVVGGKVEEPRSRGEVPVHVHRAILRGLEADPGKRFSSMSEYLEKLSRDPLARRRRFVGAAVTGALLLTGPFAYRHWQTESTLVCEAKAEGELSEAWGDARKKAVRGAFFSTGKAFAAGAWNAIERALDDYGRDWKAARVDACKALRGKSPGGSSALVDARMTCLDDRLKEMLALTDVLTHTDRETITKAPGGARSLPAVAQCNNTSVLLSRVRPPPDAVMGEVAAVRDQLAHADALHLAGRYQEGHAVAEQALRATENLDYPAVTAEALVCDGALLGNIGKIEEAGALFRRAVAMADSVGDDRTRARALIWLIDVTSRFERKYDLGALFNEEAKAAIARAGGDIGLEGMRRFQYGIALDEQSKFEDALREYEAALPMLETAFGKTSESALRCLKVLGEYDTEHGHYDEAWSRLQQLLPMSEEARGPRHPSTANALNSLGELLRVQMRFDEAESYYQRALEIGEELGPETTGLQAYLDNVGSMAIEHGRYQQAISQIQRALSLREKQLGPNHPLLVYPLSNLGEAYLLSGNPEKAIEHLEHALRVHGDSHAVTELARAQFNLARALSESGRDPARARNLATEAQSIYRNAEKSPLDARNAARIDRWLSALATRSKAE